MTGLTRARHASRIELHQHRRRPNSATRCDQRIARNSGHTTPLDGQISTRRLPNRGMTSSPAAPADRPRKVSIMCWRFVLRRITRLSGRSAILLVEGVFCLFVARGMTLLALRHYSRVFGAPGAVALTEVDASSVCDAAAIGHAIERLADVVPFRAVCLQQALAARLMLARRRIPSTLYLGLQRDREKRLATGTGDAAHAWVRVGPLYVVGGREVENFVVVSSFA
ncbi:MAG: lasso peptide biosynthesis B2 protein [Hyphomicrobium sp.]